MTGDQFETASEEINGGASIGRTLLFQFGNLGRAMIEQRRSWMILHATDSSKTVTTANTWQTAIDLSTITNFNRFYIDPNDPYPIRLTDGSNRIEKYRRRLDYKNIGDTVVYDAANKTLYLNGTIGFAGTLYTNYLKNGADFDEDSDPIWSFPSWSHLLLPLFAVGIHKGGG